MYNMQVYTITKQISKHGSQAVIVIPKVLQAELKPGTVAEVKITILREAEQ
jgi:antitoxin component of MazEF toxin-antitoxin module